MRELKAFNIGGVNINPPLILAPLAGFTDSSFRRIVKEFCAGLVYTEMVSVAGLCYKDSKSLELLNFHAEERPIAAQLFGSDPYQFSFAARIVEERGFDIIDINAGCPTPKIVRNGAGAALLNNLNILGKIIASVKRVANIPVTLKVRKGFYRGENILKEVLKIGEQEGIDAIVIHGITAEEGFKKEFEDWNSIAEIVSLARIPVIGNGGIKREKDVLDFFEKTEASGVMVGREVIKKPWFLKSCFDFAERNSYFNVPINDKMNIIVKHARMEIEEKGEERAVIEMRKHLMQYVSGMRNASDIKIEINNLRKFDELKSLVQAFFVC